MTTDADARTRHDTIRVSRRVEAAPDEVLRAFAETGTRRRWVRMPGRLIAAEHDFRVGGGERLDAVFTRIDGGEETLSSTLVYLAIEADRIVFSSSSTVDGIIRWTALVTVELTPDDGGTRLDWTEQVAFLERTGDGSADLPHLRGGIALRLNGLQQALAGG